MQNLLRHGKCRNAELYFCSKKSAESQNYFSLLQMRNLLAFRDEESDESQSCPCEEPMRESLKSFYKTLLLHSGHPEEEPEEEDPNAGKDYKGQTPLMLTLLLMFDVHVGDFFF